MFNGSSFHLPFHLFTLLSYVCCVTTSCSVSIFQTSLLSVVIHCPNRSFRVGAGTLFISQLIVSCYYHHVNAPFTPPSILTTISSYTPLPLAFITSMSLSLTDVVRNAIDFNLVPYRPPSLWYLSLSLCLPFVSATVMDCNHYCEVNVTSMFTFPFRCLYDTLALIYIFPSPFTFLDPH